MNSRLRQDAVVRFLRRSGTSTVAEIANAVGASRRTVLRDLQALREEGFVIQGEPGRGGGLCLDPQSVQTTARLSVAEIFALLISVGAVRATGGLPFADLADLALTKIENALPADKIKDLRRFLACLYVGRLAPQVDLTNMGTMDPSLLPTFERAFLQRFLLQFQYCDAKGVISRREVEPQAMLILPPLWYLVAWDPMRDDFRHFRMDRISAPVCVEGTHFERRRVPFKDHVRPMRPSAP